MFANIHIYSYNLSIYLLSIKTKNSLDQKKKKNDLNLF